MKDNILSITKEDPQPKWSEEHGWFASFWENEEAQKLYSNTSISDLGVDELIMEIITELDEAEKKIETLKFAVMVAHQECKGHVGGSYIWARLDELLV